MLRAKSEGKTRASVRCGDGGLEQAAAVLLNLVDQKRQHHQAHQHCAEVLVTVTKVVFEVIALVFEFQT